MPQPEPPPDASLFVPAGVDTWQPTEYSRGPWNPDALHGGPVAALVMRTVEQVPSPLPMLTARTTVELLRPVPLAPLQVSAEITRPGKKVQSVNVHITAGGTDVVRATAQRIRLDPTLDRVGDHLPAGAVDPARSAPPDFPPERDTEFWVEPEYIAFHSHSVEHRIESGGFDVPGPTVDWMRLRLPLVAGEEASPCQRLASVTDFGNGISSIFDFQTYTFLNPDLTIAISREPEGEWICLDAITRLGQGGVALAESALSDRRGRVGRAVQTLIVDRRP